MSLRFQRANFLVSDLDRALTFYRDVLGFEVAFTKESAADSYSYEVFGIAPGKLTRWATLSAPGQERCMAITEVKDLPAPPAPRRAAIVLDVDDVQGVCDRAVAAGFERFSDDVLETHDGRVGKEVGLLDADGNLAVIYNIPAS